MTRNKTQKKAENCLLSKLHSSEWVELRELIKEPTIDKSYWKNSINFSKTFLVWKSDSLKNRAEEQKENFVNEKVTQKLKIS